ncbi:MAG: sodium:calcium antiporter, partial [Planctomycetes bacterium]|nr:sodium:calcium antiporter [Planctomycetota bacterium]
WNESFVGTLFVAFVTSLPEMVVTIAAVRIQALDMAVGNVLGSNLFNTVIIAVDDLFYLPGPLLADVEQSHIVSALIAILMTGVVVVSLFYRTRRMRHVVSWSGLTLIALYILNAYAQYQ